MILGNGAKNRKGSLQHQADIAAVFRHRQRADVHAIDANRPFRHIVKPADQVHQRALARAGMPDQANHLAGLNIQADAPADRAVAIAKTHIAQLDAPGNLRQMHWLGWLWHAGNMVENVKNPLGARRRFCVTETIRLIESSRV